jgi:3-hydroxybutyryl-CoA dehydrogenase
MAKRPEATDYEIGILGTGSMGRGIAQIMASAGVSVLLFDQNAAAAEDARAFALKMIHRAVEKGTITAEHANLADERLIVASDVDQFSDCDAVIEAAHEEISIKKNIFVTLESIVSKDCILATNTSSLSITDIGSVLKYPGRFAGFHFFNPVPLMKIVEVISGLETAPSTSKTLSLLAQRAGHEFVLAKDSPGFLINHAGRGLNTEGLRIVGEGIANFSEIDDLIREGGPGFPMGPFELMDTTGLDVSQTVMESIYDQFYQEPRFRPDPLTQVRLAAGLFGRKTGRGFYTYESGHKIAINENPPSEDFPRSVWIQGSDDVGKNSLVDALAPHVQIDHGDRPSSQSVCLFAPLGQDVTSSAVGAGVEAERSFAVDTLFGMGGRRTLMTSPVSDTSLCVQVHALLAADGNPVTVIKDSPGFVVQRTIAMVVNIGCEIAQRGIASPLDIDKAVRLGLGYPMGPLQLGDELGARKILKILDELLNFYGDPRYRPSPWLKRRVMLGVSLLTQQD